MRAYTYPDIWDSYNICCGAFHSFFQNILNHLIRYKWDSVSQIEGDLATDWTTSPDGKTVTFNLRKDVKWQDGKAFTSADVKYNLERANKPPTTFNAARVARIASVETPDPNTVKLTLQRPGASFVPGIASAFMLMYPAHLTPQQWQASPVGTGAHKFKSASQGQAFEFQRSGEYFRKDAQGRALPYLDGIQFTVIVDNALSLAAFRAGQIHCGCGISDHGFITDAEDQLRREIPGVKLGNFGGNDVFLQFNLKKPPFDNLAVRQAVAIGIDKAQVTAVLYRGKAKTPKAPNLLAAESGGQWALPKDELVKVQGFNPDHSKDLAIARQKLKDSGIDLGSLNLSMLTSTFTKLDAETVATLLTTDLGIKARVDAKPGSETTPARIAGNFDIDLEIRGYSLDDPADWLIPWVASTGSFNGVGYKNARVDEVLASQDLELDPAKRKALLWEVQRIILTEFPIAPLYERYSVRGTRPEVFGYSTGPITQSNFRLDGLWLEK